MKPAPNERRCTKRRIFSAPERSIGVFSLADTGGQYGFRARILHISEGGLGLAMPKVQDRIGPDSVLVLVGVLGNMPLGYLSGAKIQIRWVQDIPDSNYMVFGSEFIDATDKLKLRIRNMIEQ